MAENMKVVVVGGVAAGPKCAARIARLNPAADVTLVEKGEKLSYAGCGLPYYVQDLIKEERELMATPTGVIRDAGFFQKVKNFRVLTRTEAERIDRDHKRVSVRDLDSGETRELAYDRLVLATGAAPIRPTLRGADLGNIHALHTVEDATAVKQLVDGKRAQQVVLIGGGLIGVEMAESLVERGIQVVMVEMLDHILPILDPDIAALVENHMRAKGVDLRTATRVEGFEGDGTLSKVLTNHGEIPADLAVLSVGVRPNTKLAEDAGLNIGESGGIAVDARCRTSDPSIYAAGDCAEVRNLLSGKGNHIPLGSTANKQGRVVANDICGVEDEFPGVLGSTVCRVFDYNVGRTGLGEAEARDAGFDASATLSAAPDKPHYMPGAKPIFMKLVVDRPTRRLLGAQATGPGTVDKRMDVAATAITAGMTVDQLAKVDLCYAPPYSSALDNVITGSHVASNKLDGLFEGLSPMQVHAKRERGEDFVLLDVRSPGEIQQMRIPDTVKIPLGALRGRLDELPRDKEIVPFCKVSLRGYEAARILQAAGFDNVRVMEGGIVMWPYEKESG